MSFTPYVFVQFVMFQTINWKDKQYKTENVNEVTKLISNSCKPILD